MIARLILGCCALFLVAASPASAPGAPPDPRIRLIPFVADQVTTITGHLGYQITVEFDPAERIENVSIGDSVSWQVAPNRRATHLFLKPVEKASPTNMTVVTSLRRYVFSLRVAEARGPSDPAIVYVVRFLHPQPVQVVEAPEPEAAPPPPVRPQDLNFAYSLKGSKKIRPMRVFDDGRFTFFEFAPDMETPAIFAGGARGAESLVNVRVEGAYVVVEARAPTFTIRYGREKVSVRNDAWREPGLAPGASTSPQKGAAP